MLRILLFCLLAGPAAAQVFEDVPQPGSLAEKVIGDVSAYAVPCGYRSNVEPVPEACGIMEYAMHVASLEGWCLGRRDEAYADWAWHECEADSNFAEAPHYAPN